LLSAAPVYAFNFCVIITIIDSIKCLSTQQQQQHAHMQTTTPPLSNTTTTTQHFEKEYDFENDDDSFYDFIEFGIASNGGRLSIT